MCTVILQKKVWRVSFFVLLEFLKYLPSRLFLLLCSLRLIFFQCIFVLSTRFVPENWTLGFEVLNFVNRVSISLTVEVHGVNAVGGRARGGGGGGGGGKGGCYLAGANFVRLSH